MCTKCVEGTEMKLWKWETKIHLKLTHEIIIEVPYQKQTSLPILTAFLLLFHQLEHLRSTDEFFRKWTHENHENNAEWRNEAYEAW